MARTLVITSEPVWQGDTLTEILKSQDLQVDAVDIATSSAALLQGAASSSSSYACVVSHASSSGFHNVSNLGNLAKFMSKSAKLVVIEPTQVSELCVVLSEPWLQQYQQSLGSCIHASG
jgi:hypothetical protein